MRPHRHSQKTRESERIAEATRQFLARGGQIREYPPHVMKGSGAQMTNYDRKRDKANTKKRQRQALSQVMGRECKA